MARYIPKQFSPRIYAEWGELFTGLNNNQLAELLKAITMFPNYEPKDVNVWCFIKSQLQKDYDNFIETCNKNKQTVNDYWKTKGNDGKHSLTIENKRKPKQKQITETNNREHKHKYPTIEEVKEYATTRDRLDIADKFFDYFNATNWVDSKGNEVKNWKAKFVTWETYTPRPENIKRLPDPEPAELE